MNRSRKPRRVFTAPLVMTIAALPAACVVTDTPPPKQPETRDHRGGDTDPTVRDNRDGTGGAETPPKIENPPRPTGDGTGAGTGTGTGDGTGVGIADPKPAPDNVDPTPTQTDIPSYDRSWTVTLQDDGTCKAYYHVECKKGSTCNPPPPKAMAKCPDGITAGQSIKIYSQANTGVCYIEPPAAKCPEKATCNPPPPKKTACP
jgi:hypothetical protein